MQVGGIDIRGSTQKKYAVEVRVRDEHSLMKAVLNSLNGIDIMYIVEIKPPLSRNSVFVMPVEPLEDVPVGKFMKNVCLISESFHLSHNHKRMIHY